MRLYLKPGDRVGDFEIVSALGDGAQGTVYRARQSNSDLAFALKVMGPKPTRAGDRDYFEREVGIIATLKHPSIVKYCDRGEDNVFCYLVTALIEGVTLRRFEERLMESHADQFAPAELLQPECTVIPRPEAARFFAVGSDHKPPPSTPNLAPKDFDPVSPEARRLVASDGYIRWCSTIICDVALALDYVHKQGVIHRDIKPENLMVCPAGGVWLLDFGLSRFVEGVNLSRSGSIIGTSEYMSLEQLTGRVNVDGRSDIYSLGIVLYELLTLRRPFGAPTREGELLRAMTKPAPPVSAGNPAVPRTLEAVVHKAITRNPTERYQTAADFAADLQAILKDRPVVAKPYRYKIDHREIKADRPITITVMAAFYIMLSIIIFISSSQSLFARDAGFDIGNFLFLFCAGLFAFLVGCGLLVASLRALIGMVLFNVLVIIGTTNVMLAGFPGLNSGVNNLVLYLVLDTLFGAATLLPLLPRIRAWFWEARDIRSKHREAARPAR